MLYVDMDGVVVDFDAAVRNIYGHDYNNEIANDFWNVQVFERHPFRLAPGIPEGLDMVADLINGGADICFLTSTGGGMHHLEIARQKLDWLQSHLLSGFPVAFCTGTRNKADFAQPEAILIDDRQKVCDAWTEAGGNAVLFTRERAAAITCTVLSN